MKRLLIISFLATLFFSACQEDITLDLPPYQPKVAVFSILNPDSLPRVYLNLSKSYFDYSDTSNSLNFVKSASVVIKDAMTQATDTLKLDSGSYFNPYTGFTALAYYYTGKNKPISGHRYELFIKYESTQLHSETTVPAPVAINSLSKKAEAQQYGDSVYIVTAKFNDQPGMENAYHLYVSQWRYDYDTTTGTPVYEEIFAPNYQFVYDKGGDGKELQLQVPVYAYNPGDTLSISLQVNNMTRDAAKYLEAVYAQDATNGDPFSEPTILPGNIQGGLGIFGAEARSPKARIKIR